MKYFLTNVVRVARDFCYLLSYKITIGLNLPTALQTRDLQMISQKWNGFVPVYP